MIHLIRRNLLLSLISQEGAERSNNWYQLIEEKGKAAKSVPPFELDPALCAEYCGRLIRWRLWAKEMFAQNPMLTVEYEEHLCRNFSPTTRKVFDFIGAIPWIVRPGLIKQQATPASKQVSNFTDLEKHFKDTPYAEFFETADDILNAHG